MPLAFYASLIGMLTIFIYSINKMSVLLRELYDEKAQIYVNRFTSNFTKSLITGILVTLILDSSSAVIILTIVAINSNAINLKQGIAITMGANIGTTFQSQLFAFDIMQYSFILLLIGVFNVAFTKFKYKKHLELLFYIGLLFFSIFIIEELVTQPDIFDQVKSWIENNKYDHVKSAFGGGIITLIIQSSGAVVGIIISLAKQGLMSQEMGIAIMMGAELGTCSNTIIASIGGKKEALHLVVFNLFANILAIVIGLVFFSEFNLLIEFLFSTFPDARKIANAHILFNVLGFILVLPLVKPFLILMKKLKE